MSLNSQKNKCDAWIASRMPYFEAKQEAWIVSHGSYFQGLITHSTIPADEVETSPNKLSSRPTDQAETWEDFLLTAPPINFPTSMSMALEFRVYTSVRGNGWDCIATFDYWGLRYQKFWSVGPEPKDVDWTEVISVQETG
jgi:hypothetical protein